MRWLVNQLRAVRDKRCFVRIIWPSTTRDMVFPLSDLLEKYKGRLPKGSKPPRAFEVFYLVDDAQKFSRLKPFIEILESAVTDFYDEVGQVLVQYVAPPPTPVGSERADEAEPLPLAAEVPAVNLPPDDPAKPKLLPMTPGNSHMNMLEIPDFLKRI